jgi:hypothetical protein
VRAGAARAAAVLFPLLVCACATPGPSRRWFLEDAYARYYTDAGGRTLRVEHDGAVLDVSCLPIEVVKEKPLASLPKAACPDAKIPLLGKARREGDDWDLSGFDIEADTGRCRPLFESPSADEPTSGHRRSCWNRLWEVPVAVIAVPVALVIALGAVTAPIWVPIFFLH